MSRHLVAILAIVAAMASLAALLAVALPTPSADSEDAAVRAADFTLPDLGGEPVTSRALQGRVVIVDVWATWCGPCISEIPAYNALHEELSGEGVEFLAVTVQSGSSDQVRAVVESGRYGINYPVVMATAEFEREFGPLWALPTTFVIDQHWRVRQRWVGVVPDKHEQIRALIEELLAADG